MGKTLLLISILISLISLNIAKPRYQIENDVLVLNEKSFSYAIREYKNLLLLFFDPECPHCQGFMPEFAKLASLLKKDNFVLAKLDCIKYEKIANNFDIEYYPTIMLFKEEKKIRYEGQRNIEDIKQWMEENTKPKMTKLNSTEEIDNFVKNKICMIYFGKNDNTLNEIILAERKIDYIDIGLVDDDDLIKQENEENKEFINLYRTFDDEKSILKDNLVSDNIIKFVNIYSYPKINTLNERTSPLIFTRRQPGLIIFASNEGEKNKEDYLIYSVMLQNLWTDIKDKIRLYICDISTTIGRKFIEYCGITISQAPKVFIIDAETETPLKYMMSDVINKENILNFIHNWTKGNLEPFVRSEETPENKEGELFRLVGKTYHKEVYGNDKDILIFFEAPFCKICKNFEPKLKELWNKLRKNNKDLLIAIMDATLNDIDDVQVHNFPTIAFYPGNAKDKDPILLRGKKSTTDADIIENFIKKHAYTLIKEEPKTINSDL